MDRSARPSRGARHDAEQLLAADRRLFLQRLAVMAVAPAWISSFPGCRRSDSSDDAAVPEDAETASEYPSIPEVEPFVRIRIARIRAADTPSDSRETDEDEASERESTQVVHVGEAGQMLRIVQPDHMKRHIAAHGPVEALLGHDGWSITDGRGFRLPVFEPSPVLILPLDRESDGEALAMNERKYPGMLTLAPVTHIAPMAFDVVNHVRMESYLPGVIERELYNHWHPETHAAQAIAARSFACAERAWWADRRHFDLTDTQASQVYAGVITHQRSIDAVARTRGMVLTYEQHLVPAYYSSCCGGLPARAIDAIGPNPINDIPPLHGNNTESVDVCHRLPVATWQRTYSQRDISRRIARYGASRNRTDLADLKRLRSIRVAETNGHGRPTQYVLQDAGGSRISIGAETLRNAINHADGRTSRLSRPLRSSHVEVDVANNKFVFNGRGFGHGVGLCQHGAEHRAQSGANHLDILNWYYPGARVTRAYP